MASCGEDIRDIIRRLLRADKIKLWLPPYTLEDGRSAGSYDQGMVNRYSEVSGASQETVVAMLESLREHSIAKLSRLRAGVEPSSQIAVGEELIIQLPQTGVDDVGNVVKVILSLEKTGKDLRQLVTEKLSLQFAGMAPYGVRMVHAGQVLDDARVLSAQGITAGGVLMALPLTAEEQRQAAIQLAADGASRVRDAATSLAGRQDDGTGPYVDICDQHGKPIDLPDNERRSLTLALTLHQKGRGLLRRASDEPGYRQALAVLLESDCEFSQCSAGILSLVDNYAVLSLDVCWCQLLLRETAALPEAEHRLANCEVWLRKTYGRNMERLALHKNGKTGAEKLLMGRLHLLQAVTAHLTGRPNSAKELMDLAVSELNALKVNSSQLAQLMALCNCTERTARIALRACGHDIQRAALDLMEKAEQRKHSDGLLKAKSAKRRRDHALGRTANGSSYVDAEKYDSLCSMGFPRILAKEALRQCDNDLSAALTVLHDSREVLELAARDEFRRVHSQQAEDSSVEVPDELLAQGVTMGFDEQTVRDGLKQFNMQLQPLIDHLVSGGSLSSGDAGGSASLDLDQELAAALMLDPEQLRPHRSATKARKRSDSDDERAQMDEAIMRDLVPDLDGEDEEYLDSTLEREFELVCEYSALIQSV